MSKKAVITTGGKQYLVSEGETVDVEKIKADGKTATFKALLVIDGDKVSVGTPEVSGVSVTAEITEPEVKAEKVTSIRYKAKKRVKTVRGHRQVHTRVTIKKIG